MKGLILRPFRPEDADALLDIFYEAIHRVCSRDYSPEQIEAWARTGGKDYAKWARRCERKLPWVAEIAGRPVAFAELDPDGHIDCFYGHPDWHRKGVGSALMARVEQEARARGIGRLYAEVSITARPFFEKAGFRFLADHDAEIRGVKLRNFRMEKRLT